MNRIPPNLLYLTIYNPTLQPNGPVDSDNEDAEEQAHILFYTSRERAVTRDRMLRQIGLAKALVNFAELFDADSPCNNVHSQTRRMVMVSPEPGFWIHAGIDVARSSRTIDPKAKSKSRSKPVDKGKAPDPAPIHDYEDGSVHDGALRAHILEGYERFKLTHGSFTSILASLGQQALELQLERFWTVWGWSWNLSEPSEFGENLGPLLHPHFSSLLPIVDNFSMSLSREITPVVLTRNYIIPSERYIEGGYSPALANHLAMMVPLLPDPSHSSDTLNTLASSVDTIRGTQAENTNPKGASDGANFLANISTLNMDMRKWNWPGYLTFGKGAQSRKMPEDDSKNNNGDKPSTSTESETQQTHPWQVQADINTEALEDAISSDSMSFMNKQANDERDSDNSYQASSGRNEGDYPDLGDDADVSLEPTTALPASSSLPSIEPVEDEVESPPPSPPPLPEFSMTKLHVAPPDNPTATKRVTIHYLIRSTLMLALLTTEDESGKSQCGADLIQTAAEGSMKLFDDIESVIYDANLQSVSESLPSATKILQLRDRYLISTGQFVHSSPGFTSTSSHLFNAKAILDRDPEILEVFSRGQNPQHWHIAKRGLGKSTIESKPTSDGAVYMEVFRKETSLTDVDNVLTGVVKKSGLLDNTPASR